jgi:hypothetical protein
MGTVVIVTSDTVSVSGWNFQLGMDWLLKVEKVGMYI